MDTGKAGAASQGDEKKPQGTNAAPKARNPADQKTDAGQAPESLVAAWTVEAPAPEELDDTEDDGAGLSAPGPVRPLEESEVRRALEFATGLLVAVEDDPYYALDDVEKERLVPFLTERFNQHEGLITAVRNLDFISGWGVVAYAVIRRAVHYARKHHVDLKLPRWLPGAKPKPPAKAPEEREEGTNEWQ